MNCCESQEHNAQEHIAQDWNGCKELDTAHSDHRKVALLFGHHGSVEAVRMGRVLHDAHLIVFRLCVQQRCLLCPNAVPWNGTSPRNICSCFCLTALRAQRAVYGDDVFFSLYTRIYAYTCICL